MSETTEDDGRFRVRVTARDLLSAQVEIAPGLLFDEAGVTVTAAEHPSGLAVEVDVLPSGRRLVVDAVRARRREGGEPVTLAALRDIALSPFIRAAGGEAVAKVALRASPISPDEVKSQDLFYGLDEPTRDRLKAQGPTDETLRWVAAVYGIADAIGMRPAKTVQGVFDVSARTVTNWVAGARVAGYLNDEED